MLRFLWHHLLFPRFLHLFRNATHFICGKGRFWPSKTPFWKNIFFLVSLLQVVPHIFMLLLDRQIPQKSLPLSSARPAVPVWQVPYIWQYPAWAFPHLLRVSERISCIGILPFSGWPDTNTYCPYAAGWLLVGWYANRRTPWALRRKSPAVQIAHSFHGGWPARSCTSIP